MERKIVEPMTVLYAEQELTIPEVAIYGQQYRAEFTQEVEKYPEFNSYGRKCLNLLEAVSKIATTAG